MPTRTRPRPASSSRPPTQVWSIRVRPEMSASARYLAQLKLAVDSKLRASDSVRLKVEHICFGALVRDPRLVTQLIIRTETGLVSTFRPDILRLFVRRGRRWTSFIVSWTRMVSECISPRLATARWSCWHTDFPRHGILGDINFWRWLRQGSTPIHSRCCDMPASDPACPSICVPRCIHVARTRRG